MAFDTKEIIHLLPGPVELAAEVRNEFARLPVSHRNDEFIADFHLLKEKLCRIVQAGSVEVLAGSGTSANDAVAAHLSLTGETGLLLSNGEFGDRLISQASRFNLNFHTLAVPWGEPFLQLDIRNFLDQHRDIKWLWAVHCETSTGVLNDLVMLQELCLSRNIKLCLDCISSVGTVTVNLENVYLASCSSGKALCSFPGLSMVFYNHAINASPSIPKYLDLGFFRSENGVPFTISTNLVYALNKAADALLEKGNYVFSEMEEKSVRMREIFAQKGFGIINEAAISSPSVVTASLPENINSVSFGKLLEQHNCLVSYNSGYLVRRNWIQTYFTRNTTLDTIRRFGELISSLDPRH